MVTPLATIIVQVGGTSVVVKAAISSTLPQDALIGWDAPEILTMLTQPTKACNGQLSKREGIGTYWKTTPWPSDLPIYFKQLSLLSALRKLRAPSQLSLNNLSYDLLPLHHQYVPSKHFLPSSLLMLSRHNIVSG